MRVAVVGGGLFGCTAATYAARDGHDVHVFERSGALLQAASAVNQFRLHEGYHYPRSADTVRECAAGLSSFRKEYGPAIFPGEQQYYGIASKGSLTSGDDFLSFLDANDLRYTKTTPDFVSPDAFECVVQVCESRLCPKTLSAIVHEQLQKNSVTVHTNASAHIRLRDEFDHIIVAAYASMNDAMIPLRGTVRTYQYELVEKVALRMPPRFDGVGFVVMDGPFCCVDPLGSHGMHVMGHVEHAIHATNVGMSPRVPEHLAPYLNKGVIRASENAQFGALTRYKAFIESGGRFIPGLKQATHLGSMFTVRTVLPNREHDDARPTIVERIDNQLTRVFSGKLGTACQAAERVVQTLHASRYKMDAPCVSAG